MIILPRIDHWIGGRRVPGSGEPIVPVLEPATGARRADVRLGDSRFVDAYLHGMAGLTSYTRAREVTARRPDRSQRRKYLGFPA